MKNFVLFIVFFLSFRAYSQNSPTGSIDYNPKASSVRVVFSDVNILPDSILSLHFETLQIEKCNNLNFNLLFKQLAKKDELHTLYLRDCNLSAFPKGIAEIPNLKTLVFENNTLKTIPRRIKKMRIESLVVTMCGIGNLSYRKQNIFFTLMRKLASPSGMYMSLRSNGLDSLPDNFKEINLVSIDISDNNFDQFPQVLCEMVNNDKLQNITVDNIQTLLNSSNALFKIQNRYNRSYVNIFLNCFVDDTHCFSENDLNYLNNTFPAIHFSQKWVSAKRFNLR
jgi:Leucine-rich repeat (LRR) protein